MDNITQRNHYNPCFWTAYWNSEYYSSALSSSSGLNPRDQVVFTLNIKSNKIYQTSVDNVHFDKGIGLAEISLEGARRFCKKYHPEQYEEFCRNSREDQYPVFLDLEDVLNDLERLDIYKTLLSVIKSSRIVSIVEKTFLAVFVYVQAIRSHAIMNSTLEWNQKIGIEKFEFIYLLKWSLGNRDYLLEQVGPLVSSKWCLYKTTADSFPLTDSPVLFRSDNLMIALSPRLLLEICLNQHAIDDSVEVKDHIEQEKIDEFRKRTIGNTFREIIFSNKELLEEWQSTKELRQRVETIQKMKGYNILVAKQKGRELWNINAYSNQDFQIATNRKRRRR